MELLDEAIWTDFKLLDPLMFAFFADGPALHRHHQPQPVQHTHRDMRRSVSKKLFARLMIRLKMLGPVDGHSLRFWLQRRSGRRQQFSPLIA